MYDLIIKNGRIVDGTGKDAFLGDIAITDGKIADIGILDEKQALSSIDAKKHWVTPGFIDPHSHADMSLLVWPQNEAAGSDAHFGERNRRRTCADRQQDCRPAGGKRLPARGSKGDL